MDKPTTDMSAEDRANGLLDQVGLQAKEITRLSNGLASIHNEIPTNWLDSLLTGPDKVDLSRCDNRQVEELLRRLKKRVRLEAEKWLTGDHRGQES